MFTRLAELIVKRRLLFLALIVVIALSSTYLASKMRFDFTIEALFGGAGGEQQFSHEFNNTFQHEDNVVVIILQATGEKDVLSAPAIDWQMDIVDRLQRIPDIEDVAGLSTVQVPRGNFFRKSRLMMVPLLREDEPLTNKEIDLIRAKAADTPMLDGMLISKDRKSAAVAAYLDAEVDSVDEVGVVVNAIESAIAVRPAPEGFETHLTGLPYIRRDITERLKHDQGRIIPACGMLFFVILLIMYRRVAGVLIPGLSVGIGILCTTALLAVLGVPFNIVNNVLPVLLLIVGISNCVHVICFFSEQTLHTPNDPEGVAIRTLRHMGAACLLTCATTAIGFLSLSVADAEVLSGFGWQAAVGMVFIFIATMLVSGTLMPILKAPSFTLAGARIEGHPNETSDSLLARIAAGIGSFAAERPYFAITAAGWAIVGALVLAQNVHIDSRLIETYDEDDEAVATMRLAERQLGGFMPLEVSLQSDDPEQFQDAETFFRVAQAAKYFETLNEVTLVRSYVDIYQQLDRILPGKHRLQEASPNEQLEDDSETARRISQSHRLLATQKNVKESGYLDYLTIDATHARISVHVRDMGIRRAREVYTAAEAELAKIFPAGSGVRVRLTGDSYYSSLAMRALISELFLSLVCAAAVIFVVIALLFRSVRLACASIVPNVTPLIMTVGYMGLMATIGYDQYVMNTSNVIVFAISLGIAVDNTIHFMARFRDEAEQGGTYDEIIRRTCLGTGRAVIMTSLLIVTGLTVVLFSEFVPTRRFAELTSVTMCSALIGDLFLLPACLRLFWKEQQVADQTPRLRIVTTDDHESREAG